MLSSSMALQSSMNSTFTCSILPSHSKLSTKPSNPATLINSKPNLIHSPIILELKNSKPISRNQRLVALAAPETLAVETPPEAISTPEEEPTQKAKVVVNQMEKPRLVLKFIWMEKNIGIGLDQKIPGHGTIPLSPYFFWPRKDAWEELKTTLESKPWVSQKKMIILLNQATDIINLWQQSGGNLTN